MSFQHFTGWCHQRGLPYYTIDILICLALFFVICTLYQSLPDPTSPSSDKFQVLEAWQHLRDLTQLGPRVHGSAANEIAAVDLLHGKLKKISGTSQHYPIEIQHQITNGSFHLYDSFGIHYQEVQNVAARIRQVKHHNIMEYFAKQTKCLLKCSKILAQRVTLFE